MSILEHLKTRMDPGQMICNARWVANYTKMGHLGLRLGLGHGPVGTARLLRRYSWIPTMMQINALHTRTTRHRRGRYRDANAYLISELVTSVSGIIAETFARPHETVTHEDLVPPELLYGMGLNPWMAEFLGIMMPMVAPASMEPFIDIAESAGLPPDLCSLPKSTVGLVLAGEMPDAAAMVTSNMPCDGGMGQYTIIERALGLPTFRLDVPYEFHSDRAVSYFAGELRRLIAWLEIHTPGRMDWDRLREVCEERNRALEYELELWDLLRARPAPMAAEPVYLSHLMYGVAQPGLRRSTEVFRRLAAMATEGLAAGEGALADERYRMALWNPPTLIFTDLYDWAEQNYGVAMIMDMLTYHRHPFVDTSTPETMLRDLARVIMQGPMARHTRGPAQNFFGDLFRFYEHFGLDMIWMAGHIGCKNTQALNGMFRERCRQRQIPLLIIDYDLSDTRVVSAQGIQDQVARFMETVMGCARPGPPSDPRGR